MKQNEEQVDAKTYFKVYQKYVTLLGTEGTSKLDLEMDDDVLKELVNKSEEYGVSLDTLIGGYLELHFGKNKSTDQYVLYDKSMKKED
jgi:hypothetical protein